jgi:tetratricopeptide (TPR) repeat protein
LRPDTPAPDASVCLTHTHKLPERQVLLRLWMVWSHVALGDFETGMRLVEDSLREREAFGDPLGTLNVFAHLGLGSLQNGAGNFTAASEAYEHALEAYRDDCHGNCHIWMTWGLGLAHALAGRVVEGLEILENAEKVERERGSNVFPLLRLLHHGRALIEADRIDEAERLAAEALKLAHDGGNRPSEAGAYGLLAEAAWRRDPLPSETIERHLLQSIAIAEPLEMRPLAARCHLRLASLYERLGRREQEHHSMAAARLRGQMSGHIRLDAAGVF